MPEIINKKLQELYKDYMDSLLIRFEQYKFDYGKPTNPLFLKIDASYVHADIKIMFFGQETNSWYGEFSTTNPESETQIMGYYDKFFLSKCSFKYGGPFWNTIQDLTHQFSCIFPQKAICSLWNNILKVGNAQRNKNTPNHEIIEFQQNRNEVIKEEIKILSPDIVIFFTGPFYDGYIRDCFPDAQFSSYTQRPERQLSNVISSWLPRNTIRTYHPNYLRRRRIFDAYRQDIFGGIDLGIL